MQAVKSRRPTMPVKSINISVSSAIILAVLIIVAIYLNNAYKVSQPASLPEGTVTISQSVLEEKYGLHVNLVAVTAAGGMVDLRLKILDGEKARMLLQDSRNFPALYVGDGDITLNAPQDTTLQEIKFEDGGNLFLMYPNSGSAVTHGTAINVLFGNIALEPIHAK